MYEWDKKKNRENIKNHGISFELAQEVFNDPFLIERYDAQHSDSSESRYTILGKIKNRVILFVVVTDRNEKTRIISARKATANERIYYEKEARKRISGT